MTGKWGEILEKWDLVQVNQVQLREVLLHFPFWGHTKGPLLSYFTGVSSPLFISRTDLDFHKGSIISFALSNQKQESHRKSLHDHNVQLIISKNKQTLQSFFG